MQKCFLKDIVCIDNSVRQSQASTENRNSTSRQYKETIECNDKLGSGQVVAKDRKVRDIQLLTTAYLRHSPSLSLLSRCLLSFRSNRFFSLGE